MMGSTLVTLIIVSVVLFGSTIWCVKEVLKNQPKHDALNAKLEAEENK